MFDRDILKNLNKWADNPNRKPLVLRGARQVGKTTIVRQFANRFSQFVDLNLELQSDRKPFEQFADIDTLIQALFLSKNKSFASRKDTLVFIDEIQEVPAVINFLRYFYEQYPEVHVIAAGSLLENLFDHEHQFPVGRVEYMVVRPASFKEFLLAMGEKEALGYLQTIPIPDFAHEKLRQLYHSYALIGGMPEIVQHYADNRDLTALGAIYESILVPYLDDVSKYSASEKQGQILRFILENAFSEAGKRIKFQGFGKSTYNSREVGEALRTLEKAMLLQLIYPTTSPKIPLQKDLRKSPRLQVVDTGLMNQLAGYQYNLLGTKDLNENYQGTVVEHLTGQELLTTDHNVLHSLNFWIREKKTSSAEIDFLLTHKGKVIPIEVKSGSAGKMKSLHQFMDLVDHNIAIRLYADTISIVKAKSSNGKLFYLVNMPYYLAGHLTDYLKWIEVALSKGV